jgi:hypothetical protein
MTGSADTLAASIHCGAADERECGKLQQERFSRMTAKSG